MTKKFFVESSGFGILLSTLIVWQTMAHQSTRGNEANEVIRLPEPKYDGKVSVEASLRKRRSVREYLADPLTLTEVSQLLWAAQGITGQEGKRTAPSAGALYPLEVYVVAARVQNLLPGVYKYLPRTHELSKVADGDLRGSLSTAALDQDCVKEAAIDIVLAAVYERTTKKYGQRGIKYVHMEAGHAAQNVFLQAVALNLGAAVVGAFQDDQVKRVIGLSKEEQPLYIMPVGRPR